MTPGTCPADMTTRVAINTMMLMLRYTHVRRCIRCWLFATIALATNSDVLRAAFMGRGSVSLSFHDE